MQPALEQQTGETVATAAIAEQPFLLSDDQLPRRDDLVEMVKRGFKHTGERVFHKDEELCANVMREVLLGTSSRVIAKRWGISRNSIRGVVKEMRTRGLVEPLKQRLSTMLGDILEVGLENYLEAVTAGKIEPGQLPVAMGIFADKKLLLDGDATVRVESTRPQELSVDAWRRRFEAAKRVTEIEVTVESESSGKEANSQ